MTPTAQRVGRAIRRAGRRSAPNADAVVFGALGAGAVALSVIAGRGTAGRDAFARFYGSVPPVVVAVGAGVVGAVSLRVLSSRGWLTSEPRSVAAVGRAAAAGMAFATSAIVFDNLIHFPEDMNIAWPRSVLFYPAIAFVAEVVFHIAPLAALITGLRWRFADRDDARRIWITIAVIAGVETAFHTLDALRGADPRLAYFVAPQLAAVGAYQLVTFRRHGLATLVAFRLGYYLVWHIIWGHVRLTWLF